MRHSAPAVTRLQPLRRPKAQQDPRLRIPACSMNSFEIFINCFLKYGSADKETAGVSALAQ